MIIYYDLFNGDEILSDSFNMVPKDDGFYYEVQAKYEEDWGTKITDAASGGNSSDQKSISGLDVVLVFNLAEHYLSSSHDFESLMRKVIVASEEKLDPTYFKGEFKTKMKDFISKMKEEEVWKKWLIYFGPRAIDYDHGGFRVACPIFVKYLPDGKNATMIYLKDFMKAEKM